LENFHISFASTGTFPPQIRADEKLNSTKQALNDQINQFVAGMNAAPSAFRTNVQTHFDNSVRTLMESLRSFSINANRAHFAVADVNRTSFQECLIHIRDTVENVADFLKKKATLPVFDFSASTVTRIENDLKNQTDEMKAAIASKSDVECLTSLGFNVNSLNTRYLSYSFSLINCIIQVSASTNTEILEKFNVQHFPALNLLNRIGVSLGSLRTRTEVNSFVRKLLCVCCNFESFSILRWSATATTTQSCSSTRSARQPRTSSTTTQRSSRFASTNRDR
jgi:hypothetical protein